MSLINTINALGSSIISLANSKANDTREKVNNELLSLIERLNNYSDIIEENSNLIQLTYDIPFIYGGIHFTSVILTNLVEGDSIQFEESSLPTTFNVPAYTIVHVKRVGADPSVGMDVIYVEDEPLLASNTTFLDALYDESEHVLGIDLASLDSTGYTAIWSGYTSSPSATETFNIYEASYPNNSITSVRPLDYEYVIFFNTSDTDTYKFKVNANLIIDSVRANMYEEETTPYEIILNEDYVVCGPGDYTVVVGDIGVRPYKINGMEYSDVVQLA